MPFEKRTVMNQKKEFVELALQSAISFSELCRRFNISRRTGYKWLDRYKQLGDQGLFEFSRRPKDQPGRISSEIEKQIIVLRQDNPEWGAKKIYRLLQNGVFDGVYPFTKVPARSTINRVLNRNGLIKKEKSEQSKSYIRFEHDKPNDLWQMDFKGYFVMLNKRVCHPLTITDDHSRYNITLAACTNQTYVTVKKELEKVFNKYGLPKKILTDNGSPWGTTGSYTSEGLRSYTKLEKWLMILNVNVIHGRPFHPQTQGKEERFHRTLKTELLKYELFNNIKNSQLKFDCWRSKYNHYRPHEAIDFDVPDKRYTPSERSYNEKLCTVEYNRSDIKRKVTEGGTINYKGKKYRVGKAFAGEYVALRPTMKDGILSVYFCNTNIRNITL